MIFDFKNKRMVGVAGEEIAYKYLKKQGFKVLKRNHKEKFDEVDIIANSRKDGVVFFEIKTLLYKNKLDQKRGLLPEDNFTRFKFKKIKRISEVFSAKHQKIIKEGLGWRIDLIAISIILENKKITIKHYKNV